MALLAEGDVERAMVEFRNVFRLDGNNHAARLDYANLLVERGQLAEAIGQYPAPRRAGLAERRRPPRLAELALTVAGLRHRPRPTSTPPTSSIPTTPRSGRSRPPSTTATASRGGGGDGARGAWRRPPAT